MAVIDAVLFDLDDTLCEYRRPAADLLERAFADVGVEPFFEESAYYARYSELIDESDDADDLRERAFAALAAEAGYDQDVGRAVARAYAAERDHQAVRALPGVPAVVERLGERGALGLVTNGAPGMQAEKLDALGLADAFDAVVHAGYDTAAKPDPEPFRRALTALDVAPERAVHVGNSLRSDVAGARAAGVRSVHVPAYEEDADCEPHHRLDSLADLPRQRWFD